MLGFEAGSTTSQLQLEMYGTQTVRVRLPFEPTTVTSSNPNLIVRNWSYADGFLQMSVRGVRLTGQHGTITMNA